MIYYFGVGFDGAVGQGVLAGAVDFGDTCLLHYAGSILRCDTGASQDDNTPGSGSLEGAEGGDALLGGGLATGSEDAMATAADDSLECLERVLPNLVESPMEGNLHGCGKLYHLTGTFFIYAAFGSEESHYNGMGSQLLALLHLAADGFILGGRITEIPFAGTHKDMGAEMQLMETIVDIVGCGSEAAHIEPPAQFYPTGPARKGIGRRLARIGTDFYFHGL